LVRPGRSIETRLRCGLAAAALALVAAAANAQPDALPDFHFQAAEFVASDARTPPASGWRPVTLPDSWLRNHPSTRGIGWYRMRFHLDAVPPPGMALYVSRVSRTGQFWLNGSVLNPDVRFNDGG